MSVSGRSQQGRILAGLLGGALLIACSGPGDTVRLATEPNPAPFEIQIWSDRTQYRIGEPIELFVLASADAYVTLIETDANGESHVLFPNEFGREHYLAGGQRHQIPGRHAEYRFSAAGPAGKETIRAIATREAQPIPEIGRPLGEGSTEILIIDDGAGASDTLRERTIRPKRPEKPIDIIGVPGNRPNLAQGPNDSVPPPTPPQ